MAARADKLCVARVASEDVEGNNEASGSMDAVLQ